MSKYRENLLPDKIYHIYSRAVGSEKLFLTEENYRYFLQKFKYYILPVADVYTWALLPNHFHFMLRIKPDSVIEKYFIELKGKIPDRAGYEQQFVVQCFSNFLNCYTKSFNKMYSRKGSLFIDYFKRVIVEKESQFSATAFYIHKNPVHHGYCKNLCDWKWSSYTAYVNKTPVQPASVELLDWFGGVEGFTKFHSQPIYLKNAKILED